MPGDLSPSPSLLARWRALLAQADPVLRQASAGREGAAAFDVMLGVAAVAVVLLDAVLVIAALGR